MSIRVNILSIIVITTSNTFTVVINTIFMVRVLIILIVSIVSFNRFRKLCVLDKAVIYFGISFFFSFYLLNIEFNNYIPVNTY